MFCHVRGSSPLHAPSEGVTGRASTRDRARRRTEKPRTWETLSALLAATPWATSGDNVSRQSGLDKHRQVC